MEQKQQIKNIGCAELGERKHDPDPVVLASVKLNHAFALPQSAKRIPAQNAGRPKRTRHLQRLLAQVVELVLGAVDALEDLE